MSTQIIGPGQAAELLGVSRPTVINWLRARLLPPQRHTYLDRRNASRLGWLRTEITTWRDDPTNAAMLQRAQRIAAGMRRSASAE